MGLGDVSSSKKTVISYLTSRIFSEMEIIKKLENIGEMI